MTSNVSHSDLAYAVVPVVRTLDNPLRDQLRAGFGDGMVVLWMTSAGIAGAGLLASFMMRDVPMTSRPCQDGALTGDRVQALEKPSSSYKESAIDQDGRGSSAEA